MRKNGLLFLLGMIASSLTVSSHAGVILPVPYMAQPDNQTCLPTSTMMDLHFLGRLAPFSSDTVQMLHKQTRYNRFNLPKIAREYGLYALPNWHNLGWTTQTVVNELDHGRPVILGLNQGRSGHFVLAIGYTDDGRVIINDPSGRGTGSKLGGAAHVVHWKDLLWRGGAIIRPTPFPEPPPISANVVGRDGFPLEFAREYRVKSGDVVETSFTVVNNGRVDWPQPLALRPEDPDSSPTKAVESALAPRTGDKWLAADHVMDVKSIPPGTTTTISFSVQAPEVQKATTYLQYFNFVDGTGRWFSESWLAGPDNRQVAVRLIVEPKGKDYLKLPLVDKPQNGVSSIAWTTKNGGKIVPDTTTPPTPNGSPAFTLLTSKMDYDTAWTGDPEWTDYRVQAWIYCELRKAEKKAGWDRVGIFLRDNGEHKGDTKNEVEIGSSVAMTFDSDDGSVRAGDVINGVIGDFRKERLHLTESGWHRFSVACKGQTVTYELDGKPFHVEEHVRHHPRGECGVFYHTTYFNDTNTSGSMPHGVSFAGFQATSE